MKSTDIYILGQKYTIRGDASEEYMKRLADFVDEKIREVLKHSPTLPPIKATIIASINITDELFKLKMKEKELLNLLEEKTSAIHSIFD